MRPHPCHGEVLAPTQTVLAKPPHSRVLSARLIGAGGSGMAVPARSVCEPTPAVTEPSSCAQPAGGAIHPAHG